MKQKYKTFIGFLLGIVFVVVIAVVLPVIMIIAMDERTETQIHYVDLALPSGTLWGDNNAGYNELDIYYSYDSAIEKFGNKLPTKEQLNELRRLCKWEWMGDGYKITGPNGNSIYLPASGIADNEGRSYDYDDHFGYYWLSTSVTSDNANMLYFHKNEVCEYEYNRKFQLSVRLVRIEE